MANLLLITSDKPQPTDSITKMIHNYIQSAAFHITPVPNQTLMINYGHVAGCVQINEIMWWRLRDRRSEKGSLSMTQRGRRESTLTLKAQDGKKHLGSLQCAVLILCTVVRQMTADLK